MPKKFKTPFEEYVEEEIKVLEKTARMQSDLDKYGKKTPMGGTVWTGGDLARFFIDKKVMKKRK